jgi:PPOX class probable F420-dependent enzyme
MDEEHRKILLAKRNAYLATLNADGSPQLTPVWVDVDGDEVLVNSLEGTVKVANMRRDARVALVMESEEDRYVVLRIDGHVVAIESGDEVNEHIDRLSMHQDEAPWEFSDGEVRVLARIRPDRIRILPSG